MKTETKEVAGLNLFQYAWFYIEFDQNFCLGWIDFA